MAKPPRPLPACPLLPAAAWPGLAPGEWVQLTVHGSQVVYLLQVVENALARPADASLLLGYACRVPTLRLPADRIRTLRRYVYLLPTWAGR